MRNSAIADPAGAQEVKLTNQTALAERLCLGAAAAIAAAVLCGWTMPWFAAGLPGGWSLMKANTALAILACSGSLALSRDERSRPRLLVSVLLSGSVILIAASALFEFLTERVTGLDTLLFADPGSRWPGRMAFQTTLILALLGFLSALSRVSGRALGLLVDALAVLLVGLILLVLSGFIYRAPELYGHTVSTRTSPQTVLCATLLAIALLGRRARHGHFAVLLDPGLGGKAARILLPLSLIVPYAFTAGAAYASWRGWFSPSISGALAITATSLILLSLLFFATRRIVTLERSLRDISLTDPLTGLWNIRGLDLFGAQVLREARRMPVPLMLLYFDLDGLKGVNDRLGHEMGSQLIKDMAQLLRSTFRESDIVARIGGDEFVVLGHIAESEVHSAYERMDTAAATLNRAPHGPYAVRFTAGEAARHPQRDESLSELISRADAVMYERKRAKKAAAASPVSEPREMPA